MKAFYQRHKRAALWGLLALAAAWCLWYSRPVDIYFLLGAHEAKFISGVVNPQTGFPQPDFKSFDLAAGDPEMEALVGQLETLRFHRSPLGPLLRLLPPMGSSAKTIDAEQDYAFHLYFHSDESEYVLPVRFWIDEWSYGRYESLPLYVSRSQERGREIGRLLDEIAENAESVP